MFEFTSVDGAESIKEQAIGWMADGLWPGDVCWFTKDLVRVTNRPDCPQATWFKRNTAN